MIIGQQQKQVQHGYHLKLLLLQFQKQVMGVLSLSAVVEEVEDVLQVFKLVHHKLQVWL
jgi:hypothetical protein